MRRLALLGSIFALALGTAGPAFALPSQQPDDTWMVNGPVRTLEKVGSTIWIGGSFTRLRSSAAGGSTIVVSGLAAVNAETGAPVAGLHLPKVRGTAPIVHDLDFGDGVLYAGGKFDTVDGSGRTNLIAIDPADWARAPVLVERPDDVRSACRPERRGVRRQAVRASIPPVGCAGHRVREPDTHGERVIRERPRDPRPRVRTGWGRVRLRCVRLPQRRATPHHRQARPGERRTRVVGPRGPARDQPARHRHVRRRRERCPVHRGRRIGLRGAVPDLRRGTVWKIDTSGASQAVDRFDAEQIVVGGHFKWVAAERGIQCGSNKHPTGNCERRLRLAALDADTGDLDPAWDPDVKPLYFGVWSVLVSAGRLHVGGEFTEIEGVPQLYYGRLS